MLGKDFWEVEVIIYFVFLAFIVRVLFLVHFAFSLQKCCIISKETNVTVLTNAANIIYVESE